MRATAITDALAIHATATAQLKSVLDAVQRNCAHQHVIHAPWQASEWGAPFKARRLCLICGLEEEARNIGWGDHDSDFVRLKTNGFHKIVDRNELYRNRIVCAEIP